MERNTALILSVLVVLLGAIVNFLSPIKGLIFYVVIAIAVFVYVKPLFGFYLVSLTTFLENIYFLYDSPLREKSETYSVIIFPIVLVSLVLLMQKMRKDSPKDSTLVSNMDVLLLLIFGWTLISYLWTIDPYHGINQIVDFGIGIVIYFITVYFIRDKEKLGKMFKILVFWGFILAIALFLSNKMDIKPFGTELMNNLSFQTYIITKGKRPGGFAHPQTASNIIGFFFLMGIALYPKVKRYIKILLFLVGLFFISDILSTGSKGGIGAFLIGILSFIFLYPGIRKKVISLTSLFLFCMVSIFIFNLIVFHSDRLVSSAEQNELSLSYRLGFWQAGFDMMSNRWIGAGVGGFASIVDPWPGAHSFYFSILFDLGAVGFAMFLLFIMYVLLRLRKAIINVKDKDMELYLYCMVCSLVIFLVHGLVEMEYDMGYFWLLIGITIAVINISEKERQTDIINGQASI